MFVLICSIFLLQAFDITATDSTSETDEIPDIIALEEDDDADNSQANDSNSEKH